MLPQNSLKERVPDWLKMHFPTFQLGKLDKNKSAHSLALKFGCLKKCLLALREQLPSLTPPAIESFFKAFINTFFKNSL